MCRLNNVLHRCCVLPAASSPCKTCTSSQVVLCRPNNVCCCCPLPAEGQLLKLPANKFTVREREMLIGSGILPPEFFAATKNPFVIGAGAREWQSLGLGHTTHLQQ
jgi:hypothetical protein